MSMTGRKRRDDKTPHVFIHKIADVRGGVSVKASELGGNYLREGAFLSAPVDGKVRYQFFSCIAEIFRFLRIFASEETMLIQI